MRADRHAYLRQLVLTRVAAHAASRGHPLGDSRAAALRDDLDKASTLSLAYLVDALGGVPVDAPSCPNGVPSCNRGHLCSACSGEPVERPCPHHAKGCPIGCRRGAACPHGMRHCTRSFLCPGCLLDRGRA